mgnify:FL=1|tara:strand:+ start:124 stop:564 length:441 start_codon:yes stop_codon:yes gene_type:complete
MRYNVYLICLIICCACNTSSNEFDLCSGKLHPYYYPELKYKGDFYAVKQHYYDNYKQVKSIQNSGIVRIQFHVNCRGETGNYKVETYSFDYLKTELDLRISKQLVQLTKSLTNWIPAENEDGETVNSHKFFAFKIKKGQLIDVLPK